MNVQSISQRFLTINILISLHIKFSIEKRSRYLKHLYLFIRVLLTALSLHSRNTYVISIANLPLRALLIKELKYQR